MEVRLDSRRRQAMSQPEQATSAKALRDLYSRKHRPRPRGDFNSLEGQRAICSAYITSQGHKGWLGLADIMMMVAIPAPRFCARSFSCFGRCRARARRCRGRLQTGLVIATEAAWLFRREPSQKAASNYRCRMNSHLVGRPRGLLRNCSSSAAATSSRPS